VAAHRPFHLQPARQVLFDQRWSVARAAEAIDVSPTHLTNCLYGKCPPSPEVRDRLPGLLSARLSESVHRGSTRGPLQRPSRRLPAEACRCPVTPPALDAPLNDVERAYLTLTCMASDVPVAMEDAPRIQRVVGLFREGSDFTVTPRRKAQKR